MLVTRKLLATCGTNVLNHYRPRLWVPAFAGTTASHRPIDKRIGHALMADAGPRAMTADKTDIVAKRQQFFGDRPDQHFVAGAGQVGTADRAVEQHVADMGEAQVLVEEHHAARRMAGAMENVEGQFADADLLAFVEPAVGCKIAHAGDAETAPAHLDI